MTRLALGFLLLATLPAVALPRDVSRYVTRVEDCNHWAGEEPYNKARAAEMAKAEEKLRCDAVAHGGQALRRRYQHDAR